MEAKLKEAMEAMVGPSQEVHLDEDGRRQGSEEVRVEVFLSTQQDGRQ